MSPIAKALDNLAELMGFAESIQVCSYRAMFEVLWALDTSGGSHPPSEKHTLIVWDGIPQHTGISNVPLEQHITPLDWAVAYSVGPGRESTCPILILDCDPDSHANAPAVKFYRDFSVAIPWIRVVPSSTDIYDLMQAMSSCEQAQGTDRPFLSRYWVANLTNPIEPGNHHLLANILGPIMLLGDNTGESQERALKKMLEWIGMIDSGVNAAASSTQTFGCLNTNFQDDTSRRLRERVCQIAEKGQVPLHVLLLDDSAFEQHWDRVLCQGLGLNPEEAPEDSVDGLRVYGGEEELGIQLAAMESPAGFLHNHLLPQIVASVEENCRDLRFQLGCRLNDAFWPLDILFLDLRLFQYEKNAETEAKFYEQLLTLICELQGTFSGGEKRHGGSRLPWPGLSNADLCSIAQWVIGNVPDSPIAEKILGLPGNDAFGTWDDEKETSNHFQALTLLPRLISLLDMSLPIVLFSSTGRREIIEILKPYGNIITDFEKPRIDSGMDRDLIHRVNAHFAAALEKALAMTAARRLCAALKNAAATESTEAKTVDARKACYIELYLDEHGGETRGNVTSDLTVGGCFAAWFAEDVDAARLLADSFDDKAVEAGVRYFDNSGIGPSPLSGKIKNKGDTCEGEIESVLGEEGGPVLGSVFITSRSRNGNNPDDLLDLANIDNMSRLAVNALIELFLTETVPAILRNGQVEKENALVSIYGATRVKKFEQSLQRHEIMMRWGLRSVSDEPRKLYAFGRDEVYPMVAGVFLAHHPSPRVGIRRALATRFIYGNESPRFLFCRHLDTVLPASMSNSAVLDRLSCPQRNVRCAACNRNDLLRPDYRALQYLADEVLSYYPEYGWIEGEYRLKDGKRARNPYAGIFEKGCWGEFHDIYNRRLMDIVQAGRHLDQGSIVPAILNLPWPLQPSVMETLVLPFEDNTVNSQRLQKRLMPRAGSLTAARIGRSLFRMTGEEFLQVAYRRGTAKPEHKCC